MNLQILKCLISALIAIALFTGCAIDYELKSSKETINCPIKSFNEFAYLSVDKSLPIEKILPGEPWHMESSIPSEENTSDRVKLARTKDGSEEIWIFQAPRHDGRTLIKDAFFAIYYPKSKTWKEVPAQIEDTDLIVVDLFMTNDRDIWGKIGNYQDRQDPPYPDTVPVLSKFNESTQIFEAATGGLDIPIVEEERGLIGAPEIILDEQDVFWIFAQRDGIYRYDPQTQMTSRQADLPNNNMDVMQIALSPDGSIYFKDVHPYETDNFLYQFDPKTSEITVLEVTEIPWRYASGMLVDRQGQLWLGSFGYMDKNEKWHFINPSFMDISEERSVSFPALVFESSNGLLWFRNYTDNQLIGDGMAWYNSETGEGCMFTNIASHIVEDANKQLWMVADGNLYRYPLEE